MDPVYTILPLQMKSYLRGTFMGNWVKHYVSVLLGQNVLLGGLKHHQYSHSRSEGTKAELDCADMSLNAGFRFKTKQYCVLAITQGLACRFSQ